MYKDIENTKRSLSKKEALMKCTTLCSRAEYSVYDIKEKLYKWGVESSEQEEVIEYLCKNNYINEERYAECFVSEKFRLRHWGRIKIAYALRQKRIADEHIYSAFENIDEEAYFNTLKEIIRSKEKGGIKDFKQRASVYNFALSRGFEPELINSALKEFARDDD